MAKVPRHAYNVRGFNEIVPKFRFATWQVLRDYVVANNREWFYDRDHNYTYVMTTGERLVLNELLDNVERNPAIVEIRNAQNRVIPADRYRFNDANEESNRHLPLMSVWQTNRAYGYTGFQYAYADGNGRIDVNNPHIHASLSIDATDVHRPFRRESSLDVDAVTAYTGVRFGGTAVPLPEGWYGPERLKSLGLLSASGRFDVDSLAVPRHNDWLVAVYETAQFTGNRVFALASEPLLVQRIAQEVGTARSLVVTRAYDGPPRGDTVTVFQESNHWGNSAKLPVGRYTARDLQQLGVAHNGISSVRPDGTTVGVILFENDHFKGESIRLSASTPTLVPLGWNDRTSSIVVVRR